MNRQAAGLRTVIGSGLLVVSLGLWLSACGGGNAPGDPQAAQQTTIAQTVEAERAIGTAVAATLTAGAAELVAGAPTATPIPAAPAAPTATRSVLEESAPATATALPTPTATRLIIAESDVDGNDGNDFLRGGSASNNGRVVLLPGVDPAAVDNPFTFVGQMALRVEVFDTRVGRTDGDGIATVTFSLIDSFSGEPVYSNVEEAAPFCLFGGNEPRCTTLVFAQTGLRWPNGEPIYNDTYTAQIDILARNGERTQWRWIFQLTGAAERATTTGDPGSDFTGAWYTNFAEVTLQQTGAAVNGTYQRYGYQEALALTGEVTGNTLAGYFGDNAADRFTFVLRADGNTFTGSWLYRADGRERDWCGIRVGLGPLPDGCGFSGDWFTISDYTPASPPTARLTQTGPNVSGTFFNGTSNGTLLGNLGEGGPAPHHSVVGLYTINGNSNAFRWDLLDFNSDQFNGCWVNDQGAHEWCGWRVDSDQPAQCLPSGGCP